MHRRQGPEDTDLDLHPLEVKVPPNVRFEEYMNYVKRFRAIVTKEKLMSDLKEHQSYEKPSEKKRRKIRESIQRKRKMEIMAVRMAKEEKKAKKDEQQQRQERRPRD